MKSDAKLGLIAGVAAVITIAVVYHYKPNPSNPNSTPTKTVATAPASPLASVGLPSKPKTVVDNSDLD